MTTEEAVKVLEDMIVKISIPKAAELQRKRNEAIAMAIEALNGSEIPNNSDTVSRQALLDAFGLSEKTRKYGGDHSGYNTMMLYEIQDVIEGMPPTEPVIRCKTGYWVWADGLRCSECGYKLMQTSVPQICPHCHSNNGGGA